MILKEENPQGVQNASLTFLVVIFLNTILSGHGHDQTNGRALFRRDCLWWIKYRTSDVLLLEFSDLEITKLRI